MIKDSEMGSSRSVTEAVVLMAGSGSRLRVDGANVAKPLTPVLGRPLISHILEELARTGIKNVCAVVGFESESVTEQTRRLIPPQLNVRFVRNAEWHQQNGLSVLCAAEQVTEPFLLLMGDHLFEFALLERLVERGKRGFLNLAVDRKLATIFDLDDAMKVQTRGDLVFAIGKDLASYDAIDTGVFICPTEFFEYLRRARTDGDCSLADGVRLMAADQRVRAVDIGAAWWQDVDTMAMHARAEQELQRRALVRSGAPSMR